MRNQRLHLLAAMAEARAVDRVLLIAKLDRLSRNASFFLTLRNSGVDFICCDMPDANTLTVGLFAVLAQHEREDDFQTHQRCARRQEGAGRFC